MTRLMYGTMLALACCTAAAYSLDGSVVAIETSRWFGSGKVVRIDLPAKTRTTLDASTGCFGPCFSPNGAQVVYAKDNSIWIVNSDGTNPVNQNVGVNSGKEPGMNWVTLSDGDYIYWTEQSNSIYRFKLGTTNRQTVYTSGAAIYIVSVSSDARRAACSKAAWSVWGIDIAGGSEYNYGGGCQGTVSPSGAYVTHNLGSHTEADIHNWGSTGVYKRVTAPWGKFNKHRFSKHSNDYIVFNVCNDDGGSNPQAYVCDIRTNTKTECGAGDPWDYFPGTISVREAVKTPAFSPDGGSFSQASVAVTVNCATSGATLRYTTDGSTPTESHGTAITPGASFTLVIPAGGSVTVKAAGFKTGLDPSPVASAAFHNIRLRDPDAPQTAVAGVRYSYYEGTGWTALPPLSGGAGAAAAAITLQAGMLVVRLAGAKAADVEIVALTGAVVARRRVHGGETAVLPLPTASGVCIVRIRQEGRETAAVVVPR